MDDEKDIVELSYARNVNAENFEHILHCCDLQSVQARTLQFMVDVALNDASSSSSSTHFGSRNLPNVVFKGDKTLKTGISLVKKRLIDGKSMEIASSVSRAYMRIKDFYSENRFLDRMYKPRKQINRRMRSIESWEEEWDVSSKTKTQDCATDGEIRHHFERAFECPTSAMLLLDRLFTHQRCVYVSRWNDKAHASTNALSVADVYLYFMLSSWLHYYKRYISEIATMIPAVIVYTQRIRCELMNISSFMDDGRFGIYFAESGFMDTLTVDWDNYSFKYATFEEDREGTLKRVKKKIAGETEESKEQQRQRGRMIDEILPLLVSEIRWDEDADASSTNINTISTFNGWEFLELPVGRSDRKRQQIESLVAYALDLLPETGGTLVEFCAGGGYCGLLVAALRPDVSVYLTDMNAISLKFAECKAKKLGLRNVRCSVFPMQWLVERNEYELEREDGRVDSGNASTSTLLRHDNPPGEASIIVPAKQMPRKFDVGVALHACGSSSDVVLRICMQSGGSFAICPCCYGSIKQYYSDNICHVVDDQRRFGNLAYPQSSKFREMGWKAELFGSLCRRADSKFWAHDERVSSRSAYHEEGIKAMRAIDADRLLYARECGYVADNKYMPASASIKNHVLVGSIS